jgi:predicted phage-related endonuclease
MLTAEQLEARKAGIGGSDVASIVGISPWKTKHQLYLEKRGEIEEEQLTSEVIHFGNVLALRCSGATICSSMKSIPG